MKTLSDFNFKGKTVLLRSDLNSDVENGKVILGERIIESVKTINFLKAKEAKIIVPSISKRFADESRGISFSIITADEGRDSFKEYKVKKDKPANAELIAPNVTRKFFLLFSSIRSELIIAACPEPKAGRNAHKGTDKKEAKDEKIISFFDIFGKAIFCFGIFCFFISLFSLSDGA